MFRAQVYKCDILIYSTNWRQDCNDPVSPKILNHCSEFVVLCFAVSHEIAHILPTLAVLPMQRAGQMNCMLIYKNRVSND